MLDKIYPTLEENGENISPAVQFRLQKICELQQMLERERDLRTQLYKKYKRAVNIVDGVDSGLNSVALGSAGFGMYLLASGILAPLGFAAGGVSVFCCGLNFVGKAVAGALRVKVEKHNAIRNIADTKLNTIYDLVSKALRDNTISDDEFNLVLSEYEKFKKMKEEVRVKTIKYISTKKQSEKKTDGVREAILEEMLKKLGK